jgi:LemA protein
MSVVVTALVVLLAGLLALAAYTRLVRLRTAVRQAWGALEGQLRRRRDAIDPLIAALGAAEGPGSSAIAALAAARERAAGARGPAAAASADAALAEIVSRVLSERALDALRAERAELDAAFASARAAYNATAAEYNRAITVVPGSLVANAAGFTTAELFVATSSPDGSAVRP